MTLDLPRFYSGCKPKSTLLAETDSFGNYYIDTSSVSGRNIVRGLGRMITQISPDSPTCQLVTGYSGCGKSTELQRLKAFLKSQDFYVIDFEFQQDQNLDVSDIEKILLAIASQIDQKITSKKLASPFRIISDFLLSIFLTNIDLEYERDVPLIGGKAKVSVKEREDYARNNQLWQYLRSTSSSILKSINKEIITPANELLKKRGLKGLVIIVDKLEQVTTQPILEDWGEQLSQLEDLFIVRGEQLGKLNCHVIYTIPLPLMFSDQFEILKNRLSGGIFPQVLRLVPVQLRNGQDCNEGMTLMKQMVLARAFPDADVNERMNLNFVKQVFDNPKTLERLCLVSGGHIQQLLELLYACLQQQDPPLSRNLVESEISKYCNSLRLMLTDEEWDLICQVVKNQNPKGEREKQILLGSIQKGFIFEYSYAKENWFAINPALLEVKKLK